MRHMFSPLSLSVLTLCAALAACGGDETSIGAGNATVSGTVSAPADGGQSMGVSLGNPSVLAFAAPANSNSSCSSTTGCKTVSSGEGVAIVFSNRANITCATLLSLLDTGTKESYANLDLLLVGVVNTSGAVTTGTYPITTSENVTEGAEAALLTTTATCQEGADESATTGSVTLSAIDATSVSGSYDVTFGTSGSFTGSFDVALCPIPDGGLGSSSEIEVDAGAPVCME
jgi:hypothetical protein